MKYLDIVAKVEDIEKELGVEATRYGLYSVDKHLYFSNFHPAEYNELEFVQHTCRYEFGEPAALNNLAQYLLDHKGRLYFPAHQKNARHGFMMEFDLAVLQNRFRKIVYTVYEEPNGQLLFSF